MAANAPGRAAPLIRALVSLGLVFAVLRTAQTVDWMSGVTKPLVIGLIKLLGARAVDGGDHLLVAHLQVPWTGDCAGLNIFAVLLALTLWANRGEPLSWRLALKVAVAVPLAFIANIGRILTLISYRLLLFPAVESAQLHYFIGFAWLLPFVGFFLPPRAQDSAPRLPGVLQMAAALGLVAPHVTGPGGTIVTICVLLALAQSRFAAPAGPRDQVLTMAWMAVAPFIAITRMESLWLPWVLGCPLFLTRARGWFLTLPAVLLGTIPLAAAHPVLQWVAIGGAALAGWRWLVGPVVEEVQEAWPRGLRRWGVAVLAGYFVFPFVATSVAGGRTARDAPPLGSMIRPVEARAHEVRLPGQSRDVRLVWYEPSGDGRHHTLEVCMQYRGVSLRPTDHPAVLTDGRHWMCEFFLIGNELIPDYRGYLRRTLLPFSPAGVHLIALGPQDRSRPEVFAAETEGLARRLQQLRRTERGD
jgi:exosortase/archaeosortase family protein